MKDGVLGGEVSISCIFPVISDTVVWSLGLVVTLGCPMDSQLHLFLDVV